MIQFNKIFIQLGNRGIVNHYDMVMAVFNLRKMVKVMLVVMVIVMVMVLVMMVSMMMV